VGRFPALPIMWTRPCNWTTAEIGTHHGPPQCSRVRINLPRVSNDLITHTCRFQYLPRFEALLNWIVTYTLNQIRTWNSARVEFWPCPKSSVPHASGPVSKLLVRCISLLYFILSQSFVALCMTMRLSHWYQAIILNGNTITRSPLLSQLMVCTYLSWVQ